MKILFYDLETTGLSSNDCGIVQLAAIMTEFDENNQLTILKDLADEVGKTVCSKFNGIFECNGTHFSYDDPKKFKYNFLNDLMNCF
jgi:uncharacterized protein YprB with RNaseH-like and TPR domain